MSLLPRVHIEKELLLLDFVNEVEQCIGVTKDTEFVVDFDRDGQILALEHLNFLLLTGPHSLDGIALKTDNGSGVLVNYDKSSDAIWFIFNLEPSSKQVDLDAKVHLDRNGRLCRIGIDLSPIMRGEDVPVPTPWLQAVHRRHTSKPS